MGLSFALLLAAGGWVAAGYLVILGIAVLSVCLISEDKRRADAARIVLFLIPHTTAALQVLAPLLTPATSPAGGTAGTESMPTGELPATSQLDSPPRRKRRPRGRRPRAPR